MSVSIIDSIIGDLPESEQIAVQKWIADIKERVQRARDTRK